MFDTVSDLHKDVYGFRPSREWLIDFRNSAFDAQQATYDRLVVQLEEALEDDRRAKQEAVSRLEAILANIQATCSNCSRTKAVQYLAQAEGCEDDIEHLEWKLSIPFGYLTKEKQ